MKRNKPSLSKSDSITQLAEFWDSHDLSDYQDTIEEVFFDVFLKSKRVYFAIDFELAEELRLQSAMRKISSDKYLNLILQKALTNENNS